jgi:predicted DNA-binding antitoxin AbrB/MazE fold protein
MKYVFLMMALLLSTFPVFSAEYVANNGVVSPDGIVREFQRIPHYEMFCLDSTWKNGLQPTTVGKKVRPYLSKELYKLFMWAQCMEPKMPPQYPDIDAPITREIRFGFTASGLQGAKGVDAKNIRVQVISALKKEKVVIKVLYDDGVLKNLTANYTVILEEGQWKIDDISLKGYSTRMEEIIPSSKSLKAEIRTSYKLAEKKCKQDKQCKRMDR